MGEHGAGTRVWVETKRKDGSVRRRLRVAVTMANGKRVWRTVRNDREADREQRKLVEARELELDPTRQTIAAYLRGWIDARRDAKRKRLAPRTLDSYVQLIEQRIIPGLDAERVLLARLTKQRIQRWVDTEDGSPGTVRNAHAVLRKALQGAVGETLPANPAIGVELPDRAAFAIAPMTIDEARALLEATRDDRLAALWRLALVTGLREGELLGLPRDALEGDTLRVEGQLQRMRGGWRLGPTKAARTLERIALDPGTVALVRDHLRRMADERKPSWRYHGLMFVTEQGEPFHAKLVRTEFHRACDKAGIARRRFHDLRHSNNRISKDLGIAREIRMARHGHSTEEMDRRYGGPSEVQDRAAADLLAEAIGG